MSQVTVEQALEMGLGHHQAGRLVEAETLYREILRQQPDHAEALHLLGIIACQVGRYEVAVDLMEQAIARKPDFPEAFSNLGNALTERGRLEEAIAACEQAIALRPNYAGAHANLGNALLASGRYDEAIAACRRAIELKADLAEAHYNLGNALHGKGEWEGAIGAYRRALALNPCYPEAQCNLGVALQAQGQLDEAIAAYRQAIALKLYYPEAYSNLGLALKEAGQPDAAIGACRQAIALNANSPGAHYNLGLVLQAHGQCEEAAAAYRRAIGLKGDFPEAYNDLGNALLALGRGAEAVAAYRRAMALDAGNAAARYNLGNALKDGRQLDEAAAAYREAIALKPGLAEAHGNLANVLKDQGQLDEAMAAYRQAAALDPGNAEIASNLVFALQLHPDYDAGLLAEELRGWNVRHAAPLKGFIQPHGNERAPERRLRVGYVSPDFRDHVVGRNMMPLFRHWDRGRFEFYCYADGTAGDGLTAEFRALATRFVAVSGMSHAALAERIRADGIHILVDLAVHTGGNRLLVLARKPAPVQVTFAGYPGSTGLETMDYRLTDPYLDPPGAGGDELYVEKSIRLPATFWCYDPLDEAPPEVGPLPALGKGYVTFGCLNNFCKVNEGVLKLWAQVLAGVAGSQLVMLAEEGAHRERTLGVLEGLGVARERVRFAAKRPRAEYLKLYQQIDIGLDTVPYNGHTTSLDSYFMGVPVVTLVGRTVVGRAGLSQLMNLGLPELIGGSAAEFVDIARGLAGDVGRLAGLRGTLRGRMRGSPLMDGAGFARGIEAAYRQMWREWCATGQAAGSCPTG